MWKFWRAKAVKKHYNIRIFGQVQDVGFRWEAKRHADALEVRGFVKNEPEGSLYIEAESEEQILEQFVKWSEIGPRWAGVERVETTESELKNFTSFEILS